MDQDQEDLQASLVDLMGTVESEPEDQVDPMDLVDRMFQADPMDQDQEPSGDNVEELVAVAVVVDMVDLQSAREDTPVASTPTNPTSRHTPNTSTQISSHNGLRTHT